MEHCVLCNTTEKPFLTPSKCLTTHGLEDSHKICQVCWFRYFAKENVIHKCPGCFPEIRNILLHK